MYLVPLKSAVVEAVQKTFGPAYPNDDLKDIHVSIEYPMTEQDYPGIWVNFTESAPTQIAGIDHKETVSDLNGIHQVTRWRFAGTLSLTAAALSSLERDRIFDEMVRIFAFARVESGSVSTFRTIIENNDFIGININFDVLNVSGDDASPGTPWDTNEVIYERTLSTDLIGEFVSDPMTNQLVALSAIQVQGYQEGTLAPHFPDVQDGIPGAPWHPTQWT